MKFINFFLIIASAAVAFINPMLVQAQSGGCSPATFGGETITDFWGHPGTSAAFGSYGDMRVVRGTPMVTPVNTANNLTADFVLLGTASNLSVMDVFSAITIEPGAFVWIGANATLNVYGNFTNNGYLVVEPGATINFYGQRWTNAGSAFVGDGVNTNTAPGGAVNFVAPRPAISASWLAAGGCAMYSGGNFIQELDGGSVPMDIAFHVKNANNIQLVNTATSIEGVVHFDVVDGDLSLGNNNLVFTANGTWQLASGLQPNDAFVLTNGATACLGKVVKNGVLPNATFTFPIGRAETYTANATTGRDYTPAIIRNNGSAAENFQISVKTYAETVAQGVVINRPQEGMDRAWQITSTNGSNVTVQLQHNSNTNGTSYQTAFGGDASAFITQYQGTGIWNVGTLPTNATGTVSGSVVHTQVYGSTLTTANCGNPNSWFTKTPDAMTPLPLDLISFKAVANNCDAYIYWTTANERDMSHIELESSTNAQTFTTIYSVKAGATSKYHYNDIQINGTRYYRLKMVNTDNTYKYSTINRISNECAQKEIAVYPNPAINTINVSGLEGNETVVLVNSVGQILGQFEVKAPILTISIDHLVSGSYFVKVIETQQKEGQVFKFVKM